jgi:hypothetical protein
MECHPGPTATQTERQHVHDHHYSDDSQESYKYAVEIREQYFAMTWMLSEMINGLDDSPIQADDEASTMKRKSQSVCQAKKNVARSLSTVLNFHL